MKARLVLGVVAASCASLMTAVYVASRVVDEPVGVFTRDLVGIFEAPVYYGFISQVGVVLWSSCVAALALVVVLAHRGVIARECLAPAWFFGLLTLWVLLDDAFLIHDGVYLAILPGRGEILFVLYFVALLLGGWNHREFLSAQPLAPLLVVSIVALGASAGIDVVSDVLGLGELPAHEIWEDGVKLFGILCWTTFFGDVAIRALSTPGSAPDASPEPTRPRQTEPN